MLFFDKDYKELIFPGKIRNGCKMLFCRSLLITQAIVILCMAMPSYAMLYRAFNRTAPLKQRSSLLPKKVKQPAQAHQKRIPVQPKFMLPTQQKFNFDPSAGSSKKLWSPLLAALGIGWLWYNQDDKDEENGEEKTTAKHISLDQFITKFAPPKEIQETIEAHKDALAPLRKKPYLIEGTQPPMYHKWDDIDRVINAELLREVIKQNNLDIEIPNKYIYPNPNNGKYEVFAEGMPVRPLGNDPLTLKEIQALTKLTIESGYTDFNKDNLFRNTQNNKLVIIDTEDASFLKQALSSSTGWQIINQPKKVGMRFILKKLNSNFKINKDAQTWATNYNKKLKDSEEGKKVPDLYTSRYNTLHISAQRAQELRRELEKQNRAQESFAAQALWRMKHAIGYKK